MEYASPVSVYLHFYLLSTEVVYFSDLRLLLGF